MKRNQIDISLKLVLVALLIYTVAHFWAGTPSQVIGWDAFGYYLYLPFGLIYNDLTFSDLSVINAVVEQYDNTPTLYQLVAAENGNQVIKYPIGLAIMMLPFFLIGHLASMLFGFPMDGFSLPYEVMVFVGHCFYVLLGIWYLRKVLLVYFSPLITGLVILCIVVGTNFLGLGTASMGSSHIPLFALHAIGLYWVYRWHENPTLKLSIGLGALIGLMIITRPTEILFLLIPLFWGVKSIKGFFQKYKNLFQKEYLNFAFLVLALIAVGFIQLIYWKTITGYWFYYSYDNAGEGFEFLNSYTWEFLFSFRKGWLLYTPLMIFALIGLFFGIRKFSFGFGLLIFAVLNIWVLSSWSCWWYAESFGQRSIVQSYPEMALALGAFFTVIQTSRILKNSIAFLISILVFFNIFQTWQVHNGIIHGSRMTAAYYFAVFGRTQVPDGAEKLLLVDRSAIGNTTPSDVDRYSMNKTLLFKEIVSFTEEQEFVAFKTIPFSTLTNKDHAWIKITGKSRIETMGAEEQYLFVVAFTHEGNKYSYRAVSPNGMSHNAIDSSIVDIELWYLTPEVRSIADEFVFEIWNRAKSAVTITDLRVESYERKENTH